MGAAPRGLIYVVCAILIAIAAAVDAADVASVVVGLAKCADCGRKNLKAEDAFKGLQVAIKCKNDDNGEYESKAVGELDSTGAFSIPLDTDLHSSDCFAQLHSEENTPCPGQAPSKIMPLSKGGHDGDVHEKNTFVAVAGKTHYSLSTACTSAFLCDPIKDFFDFFHKKPDAPEPKPKPEPKPEPSPEYGSAPPSPSTPIYH